eukprot:TRINITY_DN12438_c0_g1_i15.p1 TRINITY_DN12438_c0_g1~~TRINITY_DN12438_c0_g1_i15.p1  ORF type:complete len:154 (+),score=58.18 TRINITY_DN12438_c0_g1_i15:306-767(+)
MQLFVKSLAGNTMCVVANASETVESLKARIGESNVELYCAGQLLESDSVIEMCVAPESTIQCVAPVCGGKGKKKKKRIFTKPKKNMHRHKLVSMRVLKYYSVTGDGENDAFEVKANLNECPHPQCGPGIFMAKHKDGRQTCGKCSLTYTVDKK